MLLISHRSEDKVCAAVISTCLGDRSEILQRLRLAFFSSDEMYIGHLMNTFVLEAITSYG